MLSVESVIRPTRERFSFINSIRFMIDDTTPQQTRARRLAVKDAEEKARTLAETSGATLGEPLSITESTYFQWPPSPCQVEETFADGPRTSTPSPGETHCHRDRHRGLSDRLRFGGEP